MRSKSGRKKQKHKSNIGNWLKYYKFKSGKINGEEEKSK
jgi:hypothetical protein